MTVATIITLSAAAIFVAVGAFFVAAGIWGCFFYQEKIDGAMACLFVGLLIVGMGGVLGLAAQ